VEVATDIGVRRLYALCHPQHRASWRVLEKCGFERDGSWNQQLEFPNIAVGITQDVLCYRLGLRRHVMPTMAHPIKTGA
jgi:RimJ/RimL family protein N-acetyltransferase